MGQLDAAGVAWDELANQVPYVGGMNARRWFWSGHPLFSFGLGLQKIMEVGDSEGVGEGIIVAHGYLSRQRGRATSSFPILKTIETPTYIGFP